MSEDHELGLFSNTFNSMESADSRSAKEVNNRFTTPNTFQSADTEQQQQQQQQQLQLNWTFADSVAVALICSKHQTVALCRLQPEKGGHWFPTVQLKAQQSMLATVEQLIRLIFLKGRAAVNSGTDQVPYPPQLIDTLRIQVPVSMCFIKRFLFHCQLPVSINECECMHSTPTTPSTSSSSIVVWWPLTEAIKLPSLWGPEPTVHLSGPFQSTQHSLPHVLQEVTVEETLGQIAEQAEKRRMLQAIGLTEQDLLILYGDFTQHCFPSALMSLTSFQSYLVKRGLNVGSGGGCVSSGQDSSNSTSQQLFNAFRSQSTTSASLSQSPYIRLADLLFGLAALDAKTSHGDETGKLRAKYMYRYYKRNTDTEDGLDYDSMRWFVRDLQMEKRMLTSQSEGAAAEQQLEAAVKSTYAEMEVPYRQLVTERAFLKAIAYKKVRGTSLIFRIRPSPLATIISKVKSLPVSEALQPSNQCSSVAASSGVAGLGSARQLTLSTHFVSLAFDGTIYAPVRMQSVDGHQPASSITGSKAARVHSEELFYSKFVANEINEAIRKFNADTVNSSWGNALRTKKTASWAEKLEQLCQQLGPIFRAEERIVRLNSPVLCFGDIHGNLNDLMHFEQTLWRRGPLLSGLNYLFLGDYVDRGNYSIEVIAYLFSCKLLAPEQFILLRGNHETRLVNSAFTFLKECQDKFGVKKGLVLWETFNQVFDLLPIAAIIDGQIFCAHGGVPVTGSTNLQQIGNLIPCPMHAPEEQSQSAWEILWNDPISKFNYTTHRTTLEAVGSLPRNLPLGCLPNFRRDTGYFFTDEAVQAFLKVNKLSMVIRGHEVQELGFSLHFGGQLITCFSCSMYCGGKNSAAVVLVAGGRVRPIKVDTLVGLHN